MKNCNKIVCITGFVTIISFAVFGVFKLFVFAGDPPDDEPDTTYYGQMHDNYIIYSPPVPDTISFCGEPAPLDRWDIRRALDYEILKISYWHSETILYIKRHKEVFAVVEPILKKYGIPDDFKYLLVAESGMVNVVSPARAEGYWQFLKKTAIEYGLEVNNEVDERYNLEKSTVAACKYLKNAYKTFGNWTLVAASYNVGITSIKNQLDRQKVNSFYDLLLNRETARYIYRILAYKLILSHPRDYGFYIREKDLYQAPKVKVVKVDTAISSLIDFAKQNNTTYRMVKILNPWLKSDKLTNTKHKVYYIKIPE